MAGVNKAVSKINDFELIAAELAIEKKYDYVICGHIHQPQKKIVETKDGKVTYLNSGDWVEHCTALEYQQSEWTIFEYDEKDFPATQTVEMKTNVNVNDGRNQFLLNSSQPFKRFMKIFYAVQATGNGHISRAMELLPYLERYGKVDIFLSGAKQ